MKKQGFWKYPWGYKQSFLISFTLLFLGLIIEILTPENIISLPKWPLNLILILALILIIIVLHKTIKHPLIKFLSTTPAAISAISVYTLLILLMGFIPQSDKTENPLFVQPGFTHIIKSWPYIFLSLYLLIVLGFTIVRRFLPFNIKNLAFFFNHAGLWIIIVAASLGSSELYRLKMNLQKNKTVSVAYDNSKNFYKMPFSLKLLDFDIKEYPPEIGIIELNTYKFKLNKSNQLVEIKQDLKHIFENWEINIEKYYPNAIPDSTGFDTSTIIGAPPAALASAKNIITKKVIKGWISCGSFKVPYRFLNLSDNLALAMRQAVPKEYSSVIRIYNSEKDYEDFTIKVNKPVTINSWTIYQSGYNEKMGKWSNTSVIEAIQDPWLPAVYVGIFMMIIGSVYLVWMGRTKHKIFKNELD